MIGSFSLLSKYCLFHLLTCLALLASNVQIRSIDLQHSVITHGLQHLRHVPCDRPPRHMTCGDRVDGFISLHGDSNNSSSSACFYHTDGSVDEASPTCHGIPYMGLTSTQSPGRVVGWGPGAVLHLLDGQLRPLAQATGPLDVRTCVAIDNPIEVVTAGEGNVCLWCLMHMVSQVQVVKGLEEQVISQLALAPRDSKYGHRAFAVYGSTVIVIDLKKGIILERKNLHLRCVCYACISVQVSK